MSSSEPDRPARRPAARAWLPWLGKLLGLASVPVPPHVFALDGDRLRYGHFPRQEGALRFLEYHEQPLGELFGRGPLGGALRDPAAFQEQLRQFVARLSTAPAPGRRLAASLVVPDSWLRLAFAESEELPRGAERRDEVLRWKLRRLVPFRVDDLRIAAVEVDALPRQAEPHRLLLGFALEHLLAPVEEAFAAAGVELGQVTNGSLAMLAALREELAGHPLAALAVVESHGYTLLFSRHGEPMLQRFKAATEGLAAAAQATASLRELKLTRSYLDEQLPGVELERVILVAPTELLAGWRQAIHDGLGVVSEPLEPRLLPVSGDSNLPWRDVLPLLGAACQEVA